MSEWFITSIVVAITACFVGSLALAVYTDNESWLILSAVAFCVIYAG